MDIFLFIIIGAAIILLVWATSRLGNNFGRINGQTEGWNEGETLRWLRESQQQARLEKAELAKRKPEQVATIISVSPTVSNFPAKTK